MLLLHSFFNLQDIVCLALALASWSLGTGGYSSGTERGGKKCQGIVMWFCLLSHLCALLSLKLCVRVCVLQATAD